MMREGMTGALRLRPFRKDHRIFPGQEGFKFTTVADILGKTKDEMMPPVPKGSGYYLLQINYYFAELGYWSGHILFSLFVVFMILSVAGCCSWLSSPPGNSSGKRSMRSSLLVARWKGCSAGEHHRTRLQRGSKRSGLGAKPAPGGLSQLRDHIYDDGSIDNTYERVSAAFAGNER
jgi:hypothetical protein